MSVKIEHYDSWGFGALVLTMFSLSRSGPRSSMQEATYPGFSGSPSPSPAAAPAPATYNEHHVAPLYPAPPSSKVGDISRSRGNNNTTDHQVLSYMGASHMSGSSLLQPPSPGSAWQSPPPTSATQVRPCLPLHLAHQQYFMTAELISR